MLDLILGGVFYFLLGIGLAMVFTGIVSQARHNQHERERVRENAEIKARWDSWNRQNCP